MDVNKIENAFKDILDALGESIEREGLKDTPKRIAQSYTELFSGLLQNPEDMLKRTFEVEKNDLIIEKNIDFYSMCEHHFLPIFGKIDIAYIPNGKIVGFGDIIKVIDILSKRPQIQERLGSQIVDTIYDTLNCQGVMVVIKAKHMCMTMRGEKRVNSEIVTTSYKGIFEDDTVRRMEIFSLLK
ncbi:GTP cyclohydrolase I FolE [Fusobacterium sp.]|uniref:GTP cyclohydrolase I FolE n=1 Tax=Fusobacterium sp. TaxID=68766 RepID=UPI0029033A90|nr:GTP cyclohydrolase I FolE [Fusobacterium sp.]MDU1909744.1 GTP cyclohydrolase I FolE [Fusobacterium sp.]